MEPRSPRSHLASLQLHVPSATALLHAPQRQKAKTLYKSKVYITFSVVHRGQSAPLGHRGPARAVNGLCVAESLSLC